MRLIESRAEFDKYFKNILDVLYEARKRNESCQLLFTDMIQSLSQAFMDEEMTPDVFFNGEVCVGRKTTKEEWSRARQEMMGVDGYNIMVKYTDVPEAVDIMLDVLDVVFEHPHIIGDMDIYFQSTRRDLQIIRHREEIKDEIPKKRGRPRVYTKDEVQERSMERLKERKARGLF